MTETQKKLINKDDKENLMACVNAMGGKNYFLQLLEAIRQTRPHPLMAKRPVFSFSKGTVKWNKVIYKDKVQLLLKMINDNRVDGNLIPTKGEKGYKAKMNLLRTLGPMEFEVRPKNNKDGDGFKIHAFDTVSPKTTKLNYLFNAVFFLPIHFVKKSLLTKKFTDNARLQKETRKIKE